MSGRRTSQKKRRPGTLLIVNPRSAGGRVGRRWTAIESSLRSVLGDFEVRFTERTGHATALCREAIDGGAGDLLVLGGDGTFSEVASGYFRDGRPIDEATSLGFLPYGTGGDLRRSLDLPASLGEAARAWLHGEARRIDVGLLRFTGTDGSRDERCFVNVASFGIGGLVDRIVNRSSKALGGRVAFLLGTVQAMARYKNRRVILALDEAEPFEAVINNVAVCNGKFFGGGMKVAPEAHLDDGLFDVVLFGDLRLADFLGQGHRLYRGSHLELDKVTFTRAAKVKAAPADSGDEVLLDVDGEQAGRLPATFEILPGALRIRCAP